MKLPKFSWKRLFGNRQSSNALPQIKAGPDSPKGTLEQLRELEDLLQRKQTHLETQIDALTAEARSHGMKNKRAALMALKRKKRLEAELKRMDGTLTTIELQRDALESAKNNMQVLGAMRNAAAVLKNIHKNVTADKVLDIMDEVNEQQDVAKEIADAMSNPIGGIHSMIDDSDLERELDELEQQDLDEALLKVNNAVGAMPAAEVPPDSNDAQAVASKPAKDEVHEEDEELQQLAQWSSA